MFVEYNETTLSDATQWKNWMYNTKKRLDCSEIEQKLAENNIIDFSHGNLELIENCLKLQVNIYSKTKNNTFTVVRRSFANNFIPVNLFSPNYNGYSNVSLEDVQLFVDTKESPRLSDFKILRLYFTLESKNFKYHGFFAKTLLRGCKTTTFFAKQKHKSRLRALE